MSDTQIIKTPYASYFAKNSDRSASEAQLIVRLPATSGDSNKQLRTSQLTIPQVADRHAVVLSKPARIWGAAMGVNNQGVAIGNQAIFTRMVNRKEKALLGMDLVRLGLERACCADEALSIITRLLDTYGQGGPSGQANRLLSSDSSFIIADASKTWVLETAGKWWAAKKVKHFYAISNALSIGEEFDLAHPGLEDFARKEGFTKRFQSFNFARAFDTYLLPKISAAKTRRKQSLMHLSHLHTNSGASLTGLINNLRMHETEHTHFRKHTNRDICMHAGGRLRPNQTSASMVVELGKKQPPQILLTGTSSPCMSLFMPLDFNVDKKHFAESRDEQSKDSLWHKFEAIHHIARHNRSFLQRLRDSRDAAEAETLAIDSDGKLNVATAEIAARHWHEHWQREASKKKVHLTRYQPYDRFWRTTIESDY